MGEVTVATMRGKYKKKKEPKTIKTISEAITEFVQNFDYANIEFTNFPLITGIDHGKECDCFMPNQAANRLKRSKDITSAMILNSSSSFKPGYLEVYMTEQRMKKEKTWKEKIYDRATSKEVRYSILHGVTNTREKDMDMTIYDNDLRKLKNTIWEACYGVTSSYGTNTKKHAYRKQDIDLIKMFMNKRSIHKYSHSPEVIHEKILKYYDEENMAEIIPKKILLKTVLFRLLLEEEYLNHPVIQNYSDSAKRVASYALATIDRKNKLDHFQESTFDKTMTIQSNGRSYKKVTEFELGLCCEKWKDYSPINYADSV